MIFGRIICWFRDHNFEPLKDKKELSKAFSTARETGHLLLMECKRCGTRSGPRIKIRKIK